MKKDKDQRFVNFTMADAAQAFRNGSLTSTQLVLACLDRIAAGKELNAFVTVDAEGALKAAAALDQARKMGAATAPLSGIPIVVKDNIHSAGLRCTAGSPAFDRFVPVEDAPTLRKLREAGAIVLGKTNMHELAYGATGYNGAFNTGLGRGVRNAYDPSKIAGGSSSGSAAALGARMALGALGTDTGGSMRIPPALNGVASLRPTWGRYSSLGVIPIAGSRDTVGPMALNMHDVALLDAVITDDFAMPSVELGELRLGLPVEFWENLDRDTSEVAESVVTRLSRLGVTFIDLGRTGLTELNNAVGFQVVVGESRSSMEEYLRSNGHAMTIEDLARNIDSPDVKWIYENWVLPGKFPNATGELDDVAPMYEQAQKAGGGRDALRARYAELFEKHRLDALMFPTTACVAPAADDSIYEEANFRRLIQNTEPMASAGLPGLNLPVGRGSCSGLPVGMEFDGPWRSDRRLLAIGILLEGVLGRISPP
ncbi:indoleacetamide hydrolase [Pandoraea sp.]|uniref:indoleacetamide hydrolase n=1 Tax=Pandoraea sp. TaxID=1883445 RepID=UPI0011F50E33|nr:indoleacetamide hydrolase [Pandoraea sp.]TAL52859.1 MAG: indoleacetamide hydrolase [Pandoraea sp.]TAM19696.1 MAG: indoleacetamide hydrolase [Pandoraea sp.]